MNYIIDGFNLAFIIENISQTIKNGNTEKAISQLLHFVQTTLYGRSTKIIIVFDGQNDNQPKKIKHSGIDILFSIKPQTADDLIRNFIRKTNNIQNWTVVSSDNEIIYTAKDHGAKTMKSLDFINLKKRNSVKNTFEKENDKKNPENIDVDYWREIFNSGKSE